MTELAIGVFTERGVVPLARLVGDYYEIGREPEESGIVLDSTAVSSVHGIFFNKENYWFFCDTGSTNGSKINGKVLAPDQTIPLRNGDILSLADVDLQVSVDLPPKAELFIFYDNHLTKVRSFDSPSVVKFGGIGSDFPVAHSTSIILSIEFNSYGFFARCFPTKVTVNGEPSPGDRPLVDLDEVKVDHFRIIVADPGQEYRIKATSQTLAVPPSAMRSLEPISMEIDSNFEKTLARTDMPLINLEFAKVEDTASIVKDSGIWSEQSKIARKVESQSVMMQRKKQQNLHTTEDKLIMLLGLVLAICIVLILTWWLLT